MCIRDRDSNGYGESIARLSNMLGGGVIVQPVSYTHLDVYKRQVPDTKEDVKQIVQGKGNVKVEDLRLVENYLRVSGKLYFQMLYVTDNAENAPAVLEGKIPFEEMVYIEGDDAGQYFIQNVRTEFTATLVHSRKVGIRALVEMEIGMEKLADEETTTDLESQVSVYKKFRPVHLLSLIHIFAIMNSGNSGKVVLDWTSLYENRGF